MQHLEAMLASFWSCRGFQHEVSGNAEAKRQIVEQMEDIVVAQRREPQEYDAGGSKWLGFA